jgi:hypothetical protein
MQRLTQLLTASTLLCALAVSACGREKADAHEQIEKIKAACAANDRQKALDIMLAAAEKNETFGKSLRNVTANVPDKSVIDACTDVTDRVKQDLEAQ